MEVIKVGVREQHEVDGWQVLNAQPATFNAFQEKDPVGEVRVNKDVEIGELDQEGSMADPGDGDLTAGELAFQTISWKNVRGLKCLAGVRSLKERGNFWRWATGRCLVGLVISSARRSNPLLPLTP
jgi:hypothetical protein